MKIFKDKKKLIDLIKNEKSLGFVPTMGGLHEGHISLIKKSIKECKKTLVSIYINKPQFNNKKDFNKYPRVINKDISLIKDSGIDYLYLPKTKELYSKGINKKININSFKNKLCGKFRKGHFEAVADVIDNYIKIIKPNKIFLGEKDMQQLKIIEDFVKRNHKNTKIVGCKIVREVNGIPYSSRNTLLSINEKIIASKVCKFIRSKKKIIIRNKKLIKSIMKEIYSFGVNKIDYVELLDINKVIKPYIKKKKYKIFIAFYLGSTRLIDNF